MNSFFSPDFYPTPENVINQMLSGVNIEGKIILEPSAGKGNIIDYLNQNGAKEVLSCENNKDLAVIAASKSRMIGEDFLTIEADIISHIDLIIMNPPFSCADKHIIHAFEIAPAGCTIIALCNSETLKNSYTESRKRLNNIIAENGSSINIGQAFSESERQTGVNVSIVNLLKPGASYQSEFEGFFMDEDPPEVQANALMPYNSIRDLVQRYIGAIKIFDKQLELGVQMNNLTSQFYSAKMAFTISEQGKPKARNDYKKDLQKSAWHYIFNKMNLNKYSTQGLREDINKFVETQTEIPFTMKNIYKMLEIVNATTEQRMDKALLEVFENVTSRCDENKYNLEGWKTNKYYLLTEKFILPGITEVGWSGEMATSYGWSAERIEDMQKALCFLTGTNYDELQTLSDFVRGSSRYDKNQFPAHSEFGTWYTWNFFEIRGYKKGTMHFKFKDEKVWAKFNQRISKIKGYPLYEHKKETPKAPTTPKTTQTTKTVEPEILFSITI